LQEWFKKLKFDLIKYPAEWITVEVQLLAESNQQSKHTQKLIPQHNNISDFFKFLFYFSPFEKASISPLKRLINNQHSHLNAQLTNRCSETIYLYRAELCATKMSSQGELKSKEKAF